MKILVLCIFGTLFLIASFVPVMGQDKIDPNKALFEKKCSTCHSADRAKSKKKTPQEWEVTVMRMKNVRGAPISNEEAQVITSYLSAAYGKDAK